jgi:hypothetical protein
MVTLQICSNDLLWLDYMTVMLNIFHYSPTSHFEKEKTQNKQKTLSSHRKNKAPLFWGNLFLQLWLHFIVTVIINESSSELKNCNNFW